MSQRIRSDSRDCFLPSNGVKQLLFSIYTDWLLHEVHLHDSSRTALP